MVAAVERDAEPGERRWFVRLRGEEKDVFTVWFHLRQRTLHFETYVMPAPEENAEQFYEHLLRRNLKLNGMAFAIGDEDAVFLVGPAPGRTRSTTTSSTGSSARSTPTSSSASGRPCASASPPGSRAELDAGSEPSRS